MKIFKKNKIINHEIYPDEILMDVKNSPNFDVQQFEGNMEKPIGKRAVFFIIVFAFVVSTVVVGKLWKLQITDGAYYMERSESIQFDRVPVFADRGVIYDRNGKELIWNTESQNFDNFSHRTYINEAGFGHLLGYVSYPSKDSSGKFWSTEFSGKDGVEKQYNEVLQGENGVELVEMNVEGEVVSKHISTEPIPGENLTLTIDARLQTELNKVLLNLIQVSGYLGGSAAMIDVTNGEVLALTNTPEYSSKILSDGSDSEKIKEYVSDSRRVFLNRAISGLYTPGSIVKPFVALGALTEGIISPLKLILSTGSITIPNPFFPGKDSIFYDWKAHGLVDMRKAISVSSDVYFYEIGGGFKDQRGIGIAGIDKYNKLFGVGLKTGIDLPGEIDGNIPTPEWKKEHFNGDPWRIGDTYNTSIGQYGFQVTPLQMVRAIGAVANNGVLVTPHILLNDTEVPKQYIEGISEESYQIVREGMRQSIISGTSAQANVPFVHVAAKTGTAQIGVTKNRINSWIVGFFPYEKPKYAFVILAESAPSVKYVGAVSGLREFLDWMNLNTPEYFN